MVERNYRPSFATDKVQSGDIAKIVKKMQAQLKAIKSNLEGLNGRSKLWKNGATTKFGCG